MTSVDSGVETGNDSNDSSIVQHENLTTTPHDTVSTAVATTISSQREVHDSDFLRLAHGQSYPLSGLLPLPTLPPLFENDNYTGSEGLNARERLCKCERKMTFGDSGVEIGSDSNSSSIVQHQNLTSIPHNAVSTAVATTISSQREVHNNEVFRFPQGQSIDLSGRLPVLTLPTPFEIDNYTLGRHDATPTCSEGLLIANNCEVSLPFLRWRLHPTMKRTGEYQSKIKHFANPYRSRLKGRLLSYSVDLQYFNERKMRYAAITNDNSVMERLLNSGISPNNQDEYGRTPLHLAASRGYTDIVHLLLKHGANPNIRDSIGNTPLHLATVTSKVSVVTLLLQAGTDVTSADRHGNNPLQLAQTKLRVLQNFKGGDMQKVKDEVRNLVSMLLAYLEKQKDAQEKMEALSTFCSRLSLSNTSVQVQDDVKDLLANLHSLNITS